MENNYSKASINVTVFLFINGIKVGIICTGIAFILVPIFVKISQEVLILGMDGHTNTMQ
jgi:hypothetical protein